MIRPFIKNHPEIFVRVSIAAGILLGGAVLAQTPGVPSPATQPATSGPVPEQNPWVSVCFYALGDAPILEFVQLSADALKVKQLAEKQAWEKEHPGEPFPGSSVSTHDYEAVKPEEAPPSPIMVDVDKAKNTRKFLNLDHMGKDSVVVKRTSLLTLQRVFDPPFGAPPAPPSFSKLTDIPIPPTVDEMLVFIVKPPGTYEWTKAEYRTVDMSPKIHGSNTLMILNYSSFPIRVGLLPKSSDEKVNPATVKVPPGGTTSKIIKDPTGERIGLFAGDATEPFAAKINTPRDKNRQVMVIYNQMSGNRDNLKSVPGLQSLSLPIKAPPVEPPK